MNYALMDDGTKLWHSSRQCPHSNENACAFCDHDRYYAHKYRSACPWFDPT